MNNTIISINIHNKSSNRILRKIYLIALIAIINACSLQKPAGEFPNSHFEQAFINGKLANEAFVRSENFVEDWLGQADPETGLIPRNLYNSKNFWNAQDAAADNYPFMVLSSFFTDRTLFEGRMRRILSTEQRLTTRLGNLPDTYSFSKNEFLYTEIDTSRVLFGASEYMKDGLLPLTEWLGRSPWSQRMISILDDFRKYGGVVHFEDSQLFNEVRELEVNGELLQILSRIYWMTGEKKYLDWAVDIGDYYLLRDQHPTQDMARLRLRDHGCEIISGLCELYVTVNYALPKKKESYQEPIHTMLDRILEVGRNDHGMFYNSINPQTGKIINNGIADTYGYILDGYYTVYMIDSTKAYQNAIQKIFDHLNPHYKSYDWENSSADGYADAIESSLNLVNRIPDESAMDWIDSEIKIMFSMQDSSHRENAQKWNNIGIIEGWHGDGNFARTAIMYALWKTKGAYIQPWREDVMIGAVETGEGSLAISLTCEKPWTGKLIFDKVRYSTQLQLPIDWPRINQFAEWYTTEKTNMYEMTFINGKNHKYSGKELQDGIEIELKSGEKKFIVVSYMN